MMSEDPTSAAAAVLLTQQPSQTGNPCVDSLASSSLATKNGPSPTASTANTSAPESPSDSALGRSGGDFPTNQTLETKPLSSHPSNHDCTQVGLELRCSALSPSCSNKNASQQTPLTSSSNTSSVDLRRQLCDQNVFIFHLPSEWTEDELRRVGVPSITLIFN